MINSIIYSFLSIWGVYITYMLFEIFFDTSQINTKKKAAIFALYFLTINLVYLKINIPLTILITNIICFAIISVIYKATIKKAIVSVSLIYLIRMSSESISSILMTYEKMYILKGGITTPLEAIFFGNLASFFVALLLKQYKSLKIEANISSKQLKLLVFIAIISLYIVILLLSISGVSLIWKLIGLIGMVSINLSVVQLYSSIIELLQNKFDKEMYAKENEFKKAQMKVMYDSLQATKQLRHNLKNNLIVLNNMIESNENKKALGLMNDMVKLYKINVTIADTGNLALDSILNYNITRMQALKVRYKMDLSVPHDFDLDDIYLITIISNVLDNAIEAVEKLDEKRRYIDINIKYKIGILYITIENPYDTQIKFESNEIKTSKKDKNNHGIGLKSIKEMVDKKSGRVDIESSNGVFKIKIAI